MPSRNLDLDEAAFDNVEQDVDHNLDNELDKPVPLVEIVTASPRLVPSVRTIFALRLPIPGLLNSWTAITWSNTSVPTPLPL